MNGALQTLFWASVALIVYVYFGYPVLLWVLSRLRGKRPVPIWDDFEPTVSLIIAAYNEERVIAQKLENSLALDYPRDKLEIIVGSDGSTDGTNAIVRRFGARGVKLNAAPQNRGKASIQNDTVATAGGEILVFSDATGMYDKDAIQYLVSHFADPKVGCVVGNIVISNPGRSPTSEGTGLYWRYELSLREKESRVGNLVAASGSIFALRRPLFEPIDPSVSDDFMLPMTTVRKGYRVVYEPRAISAEEVMVEPSSELKVKARTISLDLRGLFLSRELLNPLRYPLVAWGLVSHKLLRWLMPWVFIALVVLNLFLADSTSYLIILLLQVGFYLLALLGYVSHKRGPLPFGLGVPYSFCLINLAAIVGLIRSARGKTAGRWVPVR